MGRSGIWDRGVIDARRLPWLAVATSPWRFNHQAALWFWTEISILEVFGWHCYVGLRLAAIKGDARASSPPTSGGGNFFPEIEIN